MDNELDFGEAFNVISNERWATIEGTNRKYSISTDGRIRNNTTWHIVKQKERYGIGYKKAHLKKCFVTNKELLVYVHIEVAKAFPEICGKWFEGCEVHHVDRNPRNNKATNLKVLSVQEHRKIHQS